MSSAPRRFWEELTESKLTAAEKWGSAAALGKKLTGMSVRGQAIRPFLGGAKTAPLVGRGVRIRGVRQLHLGARVVIEDYAEIQAVSETGVRLGDRVSVGSMTMIRPSGYYGRLGRGLSVGDRVGIGPQCYLGCSGGIEIGDDVLFGPGVMLFAEDHNFAETNTPIKDQGVSWGPIVIGRDCWLGSGVRVTSGVTVGEGSVVGAGSVVTRSLPAWSVAAGNPARVLRSRWPLG